MASDTPIIFFFWPEFCFVIINNYTIFKSVQYSTYNTYNPIRHFYTEHKKPKITYNGLSKESNKGKTKIIQKIV